jgi:hypothetical protein
MHLTPCKSFYFCAKSLVVISEQRRRTGRLDSGQLVLVGGTGEVQQHLHTQPNPWEVETWPEMIGEGPATCDDGCSGGHGSELRSGEAGG